MTEHKTPYLHLLLGIVVPSLAMFGVRYVGHAPSETKAGQIPFEAPSMINFPDVSLSDSGHANSSNVMASIHSPFWFDESQYDEYHEQPDSPQNPPQVVRQESLDVIVTSILPHPKNPMAIINSKPCRIGDELEGGWKLVGIDGEDRTVTLLHKSGKRIVMELTKNP